MAGFFDAILTELTIGSRIQVGYGNTEDNYSTLVGVVEANSPTDGMMLLRKEDGTPAVIRYRVVQDLNVLSGQTEKHDDPIRPYYLRELATESLSPTDAELKALFERLPREEKSRFNGLYDKFCYGMKTGDKPRMRDAAESAGKMLLDEYDKGLDWSVDAAVFCGKLLCRTGLRDPEVFLVGERFREAAWCAFRNGNWSDAGVYAAVALMEGDRDHREELLTILSKATMQSDDSTAAEAWLKTAEQTPEGKQLKKELLEWKRVDPNQRTEALALYYRCRDMGEELDYWNPREQAPSAPAKAPELEKPVQKKVGYTHFGRIKYLQWIAKTGTLVDVDGVEYPFAYRDIDNPGLKKAIEAFCDGKMNGKIYWVRFAVEDGSAKHIQPGETALQRARQFAADLTMRNRFAAAVKLCKACIGTPDEAEALGDLLQYAVEQHKMDQDTDAIRQVERLAREKLKEYPVNAKMLSSMAQIYRALEDFPKAIETCRQALDCPGLPARMEMTILAQTARYGARFLESEESRDRKIARLVEESAVHWLKLYHDNHLESDNITQKTLVKLTAHRVMALCVLDQPEQAQKAFEAEPLPMAKQTELDQMEALIAETRSRLAPKQPLVEQKPAQPVPEQTAEPEKQPVTDAEADPEEEEPIEPYVDSEGREALDLTDGQIVDYALSIRGPGQISTALAYLNAASRFFPGVEPVWKMAALAADDPMADTDYSVDALMGELAAPDHGRKELKELCAASAYLRHCFGGDSGAYGVDTLRGSIQALDRIPGLGEICEKLTRFSRTAGQPMALYLSDPDQDDRTAEAALAELSSRAGDIYARYVQTPPRLDAKMARWIETRRILFSRESRFGLLLEKMKNGDREGMEELKPQFARMCGMKLPSFTQRRLTAGMVDAMIDEAWEEAGKRMPTRKATATPQGALGNNLRSSVTEAAGAVFQWYSLTEQCAGKSWRSDDGRALCGEMRPELAEQLRICADQWQALADSADDRESLGFAILAHTGREIADRLAGTWTEDRRKFFYADFLRSDEVLLDGSFQPELDASFCALEEHNILARIRRHAEGEKLTLQAHLDRIYGREKQYSNYGTADQILAYCASGLAGEQAEAPENAALFRSQTEKQAQMRLRIFRENYAMAMSCGQIERSDSFCYHLENTVRFWFARWSGSGNYGAAMKLMELGEQQIRRSARRYEQQLQDQLNDLAAGDPPQFRSNPEYIEAIRTQIAQQNFIVAEDWMNQARQGRLHIEQERREALVFLDRFWSGYAGVYNQVADTSRPLKSLVGNRIVRNKDARGAQALIDSWLGNGGPTPVAKINSLLDLLGWKNMKAEPFRFAGDPKAELFAVTREGVDVGRENPLHPIADFGSRVSRDGMYVACLYGSYDCERLFEKIRAMDALNGNKVIFLDYALGSTDRRLLARKLKRREAGLANTYLVIDRVMLMHFANHYNENLMNRIVMAVGMPFSYCQPYVADSSHTMPPEIFIGRKDELLKIEQPGGVNLIFGGRQLGKSALLKKARGDIDGSQQRRAVLLDLKDCGCAAAAKKLCWELMDLGILPDEEVTDDWEVLCRRIRRRLRQEDDVLRYLLILMDEADAFIADCAGCGYKPLVALKEIQQTLDGRFKFVLAGLHNIVRFNREVALGQNAVITHLPSLKVTPFRPAEAEELLTGPLSYLGFSLQSKVTVSQILATANYFPGLIQLYGQKLIECVREADYAGYDLRSTPPYAVSEHHLRRVMADREFTDQIQEKFEITLRLDEGYYPLALLIGWMYYVCPSRSGYSAKDVLFHAKDLHVRALENLSEEQIDALMQELMDLNILRSMDRDTYLLSSKNFRDLLGSEEEIFEKLSNVGGGAQ